MLHTRSGVPTGGQAYRVPSEFMDFDVPAVREFAESAAAAAAGELETGVKLFYAVRDRVRYDPYRISDAKEDFKASTVLERGEAWCVPKAVLLTACARAVGIEAGIGLSDVTNHLCSPRLLEAMGGKDLFIYHGYCMMRLEGRWLKAAPAFNIELCEKFGVRPTEFDGRSDALFQEFDQQGRKHMEYVTEHGVWSDLPFERIIRDFDRFYGPELWQRCRDAVAANAAKRARRFEDEARTG